jgi:hypothetical protein
MTCVTHLDHLVRALVGATQAAPLQPGRKQFHALVDTIELA